MESGGKVDVWSWGRGLGRATLGVSSATEICLPLSSFSFFPTQMTGTLGSALLLTHCVMQSNPPGLTSIVA